MCVWWPAVGCSAVQPPTPGTVKRRGQMPGGLHCHARKRPATGTGRQHAGGAIHKPPKRHVRVRRIAGTAYSWQSKPGVGGAAAQTRRRCSFVLKGQVTLADMCARQSAKCAALASKSCFAAENSRRPTAWVKNRRAKAETHAKKNKKLAGQGKPGVCVAGQKRLPHYFLAHFAPQPLCSGGAVCYNRVASETKRGLHRQGRGLKG